MRWTTWGAVLVLLGIGTSQAEATDGCVTQPCYTECHSYSGGYGPPACYVGSGIWGNSWYGYTDYYDDECLTERLWRGLCRLEWRKNQWLLKTFCGHDDHCGSGGYYYSNECAPHTPAAYYGH